MQYAAVLLAAVAATASAKAIPSQPTSAHPVEPTGNYPSATVPPLERIYPTLVSLTKNDEEKECYVNVKSPNCDGRSAKIADYDTKLNACVHDSNASEHSTYAKAQICKEYTVALFSKNSNEANRITIPPGQVNFYFFNGVDQKATPLNANWTAPLGTTPGTWSAFNSTSRCWRGNGTAEYLGGC